MKKYVLPVIVIFMLFVAVRQRLATMTTTASRGSATCSKTVISQNYGLQKPEVVKNNLNVKTNKLMTQ